MSKRLRFSPLLLVLMVFLWTDLAWAQRGGEKIKISYTATTMTLLPLFVGVHNGVYEREGFQVDLVRISGGSVIPAALLNRQLDYTITANISLFAGLPIRIIAANQVKNSLTLVVRPEIKKGADLKGKVIAVARAGSLTDYIARELGRYYGLNPDRGEITTFGVGDLSARLLALQTNVAQGAILEAPNNIQAEALGFKILVSASDVIPAMLQNGFSTSLAKIQEERPQVKRALRAFIKSQMLTAERPDIVIPFVMRYWNIDKPTAEKSYNRVLGTFAKDGVPSRESLTNAINWAVALTKGSRSISMEDVFTRDLLDEVHQELGLRK